MSIAASLIAIITFLGYCPLPGPLVQQAYISAFEVHPRSVMFRMIPD